jgi:hypothetical protein
VPRRGGSPTKEGRAGRHRFLHRSRMLLDLNRMPPPPPCPASRARLPAYAYAFEERGSVNLHRLSSFCILPSGLHHLLEGMHP